MARGVRDAVHPPPEPAHDLLDGEALVSAEEPRQGALHRPPGDALGRLGEDQGAPRPAERAGASKDDTVAHKTEYVGDKTISEKGVEALKAWYADDYKLLAIADAFRAGTAQAKPTGLARLTSLRGSLDKRSAATG